MGIAPHGRFQAVLTRHPPALGGQHCPAQRPGRAEALTVTVQRGQFLARGPWPPASRGLRKQLLILGRIDLVILENAVFPPRESQKSLGGKVGDGKGVAIQMKRNKNTRPSTAVSDLAEAAVMGEKSVSLISKGLGGEVWRRDILPGPRPTRGTALGP